MSKTLVISFRYSYFRENEVRCPLKIIKSIEMYLFKQFFLCLVIFKICII